MKSTPLKITLLALPLSAYGHHPMGGETPETTIQGLLSGLGHPIVEMDHFIFVVGFAYLLAVCSRHILSHIGLFLGLAILGTVGRLVFPEISFFEAGVFVTTVLVGVLLIIQRLDHDRLLWILSPVAGLFHGYGYGGAVVGAENTPLFAYLLGFSLIQAVLMLGTIGGVKRLAGDRLAVALSGYRSISGAVLIGLAFIV